MNKNFKGVIPTAIELASKGIEITRDVISPKLKTGKFHVYNTLSHFTSDIAKTVINEFKYKPVYTLRVTFVRGYLHDFLSKHFKHIDERVERYSDPFETDPIVEIKKDTFGTSAENYNVIDHAIIDGIPVRLVISVTPTSKEHHRSITSIFLQTLRINNYPERLKETVRNAVISECKKDAEPLVISVDEETNRLINVTQHRTFENVFIPDDIQNLIVDTLRKFKNSADWYNDHMIPYHFGILLHGLPGMGKTSIAQAIASELKSTLYVLSGDDIFSLSEVVTHNIDTTCLRRGEYAILLIEDIDSGLKASKFKKRSQYNEDEYREAGLASILNVLDGVGSPQNIIYIFTTNHKEDIDPALIRPGRIDLDIEIKPIDNETLRKFIKFHYNEDVDLSDFEIRDNMSFAELQVKVMTGYSIDELLNHVRK